LYPTMRRAATLIVLVCIVAGCGAAAVSSPSESPGVFITRILREEINGQWGRQWGELHPAHQRLITRAQYVACSREMATNIATGREVFHVLDVRNETIHVQGVPQRSSKLVTISFHARGSANALTYRLHAVDVNGRWAWILGPAFIKAVDHGRCLNGSPLLERA
jgi:hypothetical protein